MPNAARLAFLAKYGRSETDVWMDSQGKEYIYVGDYRRLYLEEGLPHQNK
jgi:hypothetical protein